MKNENPDYCVFYWHSFVFQLSIDTIYFQNNDMIKNRIKYTSWKVVHPNFQPAEIFWEHLFSGPSCTMLFLNEYNKWNVFNDLLNIQILTLYLIKRTNVLSKIIDYGFVPANSWNWSEKKNIISFYSQHKIRTTHSRNKENCDQNIKSPSRNEYMRCTIQTHFCIIHLSNKILTSGLKIFMDLEINLQFLVQIVISVSKYVVFLCCLQRMSMIWFVSW